MKKIISLLLLLIVFESSYGQPKQSAPQLTKIDYLKKSQNQKFIAWLLFAGGAAVAGITGLSNLSVDFGSQNKRTSPVVPLVIGGSIMLGSIPLFIASSKNKRLANTASASFKMETRPIIQQTSFHSTSYPALAVHLKL